MKSRHTPNDIREAYWELMDIAAAQIEAAHGIYEITLLPSTNALHNYDVAVKLGETISLERIKEGSDVSLIALGYMTGQHNQSDNCLGPGLLPQVRKDDSGGCLVYEQSTDLHPGKYLLSLIAKCGR
jgi:hypothetical protein